MQIVVNKVENGYICTKDGKMYVFAQLTQVVAFFVREFDDCIITRLLDELTYPPKQNESITSNSE
jgi:hypothetical protein